LGLPIRQTGRFDRSGARSTEELSAISKVAKNIFSNARDCKKGSREVRLAIESYNNDKWWFRSVYRHHH
jgi:hypothetical protein